MSPVLARQELNVVRVGGKVSSVCRVEMIESARMTKVVGQANNPICLSLLMM